MRLIKTRKIPPAFVTLAMWNIETAQEKLEKALKQLLPSKGRRSRWARLRISNAIQDTIAALDDLRS